MDIALLVLRLVFGLLLAAHGAQKLFGWFGGHGLGGTAGWLGSLNLKPASLWAFVAGASEFFGGLLIALGLLTPLGALVIIAVMITASLLVHLPNGLWASDGGYELPLVLGAGATALFFAGPGAYSLDAVLGTVVPWPVSIVAAIAIAGSIVYLLLSHRAVGEKAPVAGEA